VLPKLVFAHPRRFPQLRFARTSTLWAFPFTPRNVAKIRSNNNAGVNFESQGFGFRRLEISPFFHEKSSKQRLPSLGTKTTLSTLFGRRVTRPSHEAPVLFE
jgi:hypothetical protein